MSSVPRSEFAQEKPAASESVWRESVRSSLFVRLAIAYFVLMGSATVIVGQSGRHVIERIEQAALQNLSWTLANEIAPSLQEPPDGEPQVITNQKYQSAFAAIRKLNPTIDLYVVDAQGIIPQQTSSLPSHTSRIDMEPIRRFLSWKGYTSDPILGDVPGTKKREVFSVCRIPHFKQEKYLYVVLRNGNLHNSRRVHGDHGLVILASGASITFLLLAIVAGLYLFQRITRRISQMTAVLQRFRSGDYSPRLLSPASDELGLHAAAINEMADKIELSLEEIRVRDKLRRELIAGLSHDLRRPLALSYSLAETLVEWERLDAERRTKYLGQLLDTQSSALSLIDQLFELAKLEAKELMPAIDRLPVQPLLESELRRQLSTVESKMQTLEIEAPADLPDALGDPAMIRRVVANLLENAVRHTPRGSAIVMSAHYDPRGKIIIRVCDSGPGIPDDEVSLIFETFYRGRSVQGGGSGLGLAISRRLVEAHGSHLAVSRGEGGGAVFEFSLDASTPEAPEHPPHRPPAAGNPGSDASEGKHEPDPPNC